ncbi:MAG: M56 family metallopeptidase [Christensenella sp.]|uniref:M56 family metallopeptidase n=1 Tax=Christensenella sp. TaxID=1935934 RepID=UPI002B1F01E8|nr:M56 family metallopeptidase [Christensenella sp.]MEA5001993.1 M56 family metallopeptidase [Christensenella sp.]
MAVANTLLSVSVYAVVIFCGIVLFQKLLKNKLSPTLQYGLWFLLIARLLVPITIESGFHFITLPANAVQQTVPYTTGTAAQTITGTPAAHVAALSAQQIVLIVWLAGVAVVMAYMLLYAARMHAMLQKNGVLPDSRIARIFEQCKEEAGVRRAIPMRLCIGLTTPALTVAFCPKLLLPADMADADDGVLRYAMLHELTHYRRRDYLVRMLVNLLKAVWWFNPVVWLADRRIVTDMEIACDSLVVKRMDKEEKKRYANTVLTMFSGEEVPRYLLGMALGSSRQVAEQRIRGIYMKQNTKKSIKLAAVALSAVMLVACFTTACSLGQAADKDMQAQAETPAPAATESAPAVDDAASMDPQPAELPEAAVTDGVSIQANMSPVAQNEAKVKYIFTVENNSGKTIENCKVEASAIKEGQMGDTFSLEDGQKKTMEWTTQKQVPITVEAVLTFQKDGETKSCMVSLSVPEYIGNDADAELPEQPAPANVPTPTPQPSAADYDAAPTPTPSADEGPVPTPTPAPVDAPAPVQPPIPTPTPSAAIR